MAVAILAFAALAMEPMPPAPPPSATAERHWRRVPRADGDYSVALFWDPASVVRDGDLVRVMTRVTTTLADYGVVGDQLQEIRCSDAAWRIIRTTSYTPDGRAMTADTPEESPQAHFQPNSDPDLETLRAAIC